MRPRAWEKSSVSSSVLYRMRRAFSEAMPEDGFFRVNRFLVSRNWFETDVLSIPSSWRGEYDVPFLLWGHPRSF